MNIGTMRVGGIEVGTVVRPTGLYRLSDGTTIQFLGLKSFVGLERVAFCRD